MVIVPLPGLGAYADRPMDDAALTFSGSRPASSVTHRKSSANVLNEKWNRLRLRVFISNVPPIEY